MVSNGTSSALNSEQDLGSLPTAQGGLSRLAIARLKSAGVPVVPLLRRVGLTPEVIADPGERLIVRSQITLLDGAAIALQDDCLGFTLARDFDPREIGLLYYVMASSQTLGDALKRVARYSQITNEALVVRYREGNGLIISLSYSGVPRHSERHQIEFCMFAVLRICRVLTGQNLVPQHFWISHHRSGTTNSEMARFVGTAVEFGATWSESSRPNAHVARHRSAAAVRRADRPAANAPPRAPRGRGRPRQARPIRPAAAPSVSIRDLAI